MLDVFLDCFIIFITIYYFYCVYYINFLQGVDVMGNISDTDLKYIENCANNFAYMTTTYYNTPNKKEQTLDGWSLKQCEEYLKNHAKTVINLGKNPSNRTLLEYTRPLLMFSEIDKIKYVLRRACILLGTNKLQKEKFLKKLLTQALQN